jgi:hypothetical protein
MTRTALCLLPSPHKRKEREKRGGEENAKKEVQKTKKENTLGVRKREKEIKKEIKKQRNIKRRKKERKKEEKKLIDQTHQNFCMSVKGLEEYKIMPNVQTSQAISGPRVTSYHACS